MSNKKGKGSKALARLNDIFQEVGLGTIETAETLQDAQMLAENAGYIAPTLPTSEYKKCNGKNCYPTRQRADEVRKTRMQKGAGKLLSYHCPDCGFFHISSRS